MRHTLVVILFWVSSLCIYAQNTFEFGMHCGLAGYNSRHSYVSTLASVNAGFQAAYAYYSPKVVGLRIGLTADMHRAGWRKKDYTDSYTTTDIENETMQVDYNIGSFSEIYTTWSVGIPVQIALSWNNLGIYLGPKVVFPLYYSRREIAQEAALSIYYPDYNNRIYESYILSATRSFEMENNGKATAQKVQWWATMEISYRIPFNSHHKTQSGVMIGVYTEYCFTNENVISEKLQPSLIMLTDMHGGFPLSRVLSSILVSERQGRALVRSFAPFNIGVKVAYMIAPYSKPRKRDYQCRCSL